MEKRLKKSLDVSITIYSSFLFRRQTRETYVARIFCPKSYISLKGTSPCYESCRSTKRRVITDSLGVSKVCENSFGQYGERRVSFGEVFKTYNVINNRIPCIFF
jgi:hypothetical protein